MPRLLAPLPVLALLLTIVAACDDTPRGVQGIDFTLEGGRSEDAGDADLGDVHGPCQEEPDPTGVCAALGGASTLYTHHIVCDDHALPQLLDCQTPDAGADAGTRTFCCTTGLI